MLLELILFNVLATVSSIRSKRYLVYPDGGPARAQFIIGLGIPVDLKEAAVTVGTVIKFQYDLPTNSSEYTTRFYGFAPTVSRNMEEDGHANKDSENEGLPNTISRDLNNEVETDNNTLVDLTFNDRKKRNLEYSEGGVESNDLVSETTTELSLQEAIRRQELKEHSIHENVDDEFEEPQRMNRWDLYKVLEHMMERYGYTGRPCLLRTICEAAEVPFTHENGLLGEIGHILFTPSTTRDSLSHHTDNEYHAAERLGRDEGIDCETLFPECEGSVLDTFTEIGINTLHKFGLA